MSDKLTTIADNIVGILELLGGGIIAFLSFMGKSMYNNFMKLTDRVEELEKEQREDALLIKQVEKDYQHEVKRIESDILSKVDRIEEITEIRLKAIDENTIKLTETVKDLNEVVQEIRRASNL